MTGWASGSSQIVDPVIDLPGGPAGNRTVTRTPSWSISLNFAEPSATSSRLRATKSP